MEHFKFKEAEREKRKAREEVIYDAVAVLDGRMQRCQDEEDWYRHQSEVPA